MDSLLRDLERSEEKVSVERMDLLLEIGRELYPKDPDSAMSFVDRAGSIARELGDRSGSIASANLKGVIHYSKGEHAEALPHWKRVLDLKKEGGAPVEIARIRNNLGLLYQKMGGYVEALEQHQKAYHIRDSLGRAKELAQSSNNLGNIHYLRENYGLAEFYYREALRERKEHGGTEELIGSYNNMGMIHRVNGDGGEALRYFRKAYSLAREREQYVKMGDYALNLSSAHRMLGNEDSAAYYLERSDAFFRRVGNREGLLGTMIERASFFEEQGKERKALSTAERAYELADTLGSVPRKEEASALLSGLYSSLGAYQKAYRFLRINSELNDSLSSEDEKERMDKMEDRFQARKKEKALKEARMRREKAEIERERLLTLAIGGGVFFLLLTAFLYFAYRQKKRANQQLSERNERIEKEKDEKELLLQELQHRVKNNLQLILSLLNLQKDRIKDPEAKQVHQDSQNRVHSMALLHERMYHLSELDRDRFQNFIQELGERLLETYGKEDSIDLELEVDVDKLGQDTLSPVALILNELLSNALKYGFDKREEGTVRVTVRPENEDLYLLEVNDDGRGFEEAPMEGKERTYGLDLVRSLAEQLDGHLEKRAQGEGSCFQVYFKNMG